MMANFTTSSGKFIPRHLLGQLQRAMRLSPVVVLQGARQTGKSTLVQSLDFAGKTPRYVSLDEGSALAAAARDPVTFVSGGNSPLIIDEVQRVPDLFLAIKAEVDRNRQAGRFLLTGSANALMLPRIADSLAGRLQILTLHPFSQDELSFSPSQLIDALFEHPDCTKTIEPLSTYPSERTALIQKIIRGGYPMSVFHDDAVDRQMLFSAYITSLLQRDVRDLANVEGLVIFPQLLALLASRSSSLLNMSDLSRSIGIPHNTLRRYLGLLETTFLLWRLPPWASNLGLRLSKSPKLMMSDTGLMAHLIGADQQRLVNEPTLLGMFLETFVANELTKQLAWSRTIAHLYHFQTAAQQEVDLVLERPDGKLVGIEVKASATIGAKDFKGLDVLRKSTGDKFLRGAILYTGERVVPFESNLSAIPVSALWQHVA
ncbi:MAG: ATP-binding protein [Anaerolineae bacterium]|nr:ATP-binding protein [Anaerolineae bacterium]